MDEGPRASRFRRRLTMLLLVVYAAFVMVITLTPQMPGSGFVGRVVHRVLASLHARGLFESVNFLTIEFLGNILMFVPLGIFVALLVSRRHWWVLLFLGTIFSGVIELGQLLFLPDRFPEVRDLISNSTGFLLGATASVTFRLIVAHRDGLVERDRREAAQRAANSRHDHQRQ
ncbi:glycopeptide antibiotics resistance protein [Homoserinimonas aerilata]|uniref:Glycopeptide antibiotics resistance protein n=1 Tax=Homoserinimonas aerilata TaxID=1162970 RepID=A0A542YKJ3_9MICO|nr:VanZ family protein [Homoserinimonas aerilata]TQL48617.1 glycopeptide antibiotics resistance protein [Homoserinimonas aerilata]